MQANVVRPSGNREEVPGAGKLGMAIFLVSLTVLFGAGVVAYVVVRSRAEVWRPAGSAGLPLGLWVGTASLLGCSVTVQRALGAIRLGNQLGLRRNLLATGVLALVFSVSQVWNWIRFYEADVVYGHSLYGFTFYMLTGLHALHVLGGLGSLGTVTVQAYRGV